MIVIGYPYGTKINKLLQEIGVILISDLQVISEKVTDGLFT